MRLTSLSPNPVHRVRFGQQDEEAATLLRLKKLDPRTRDALSRYKGGPIEALLRTEREIGEPETKLLKEAGYQVYGTIGPIVSGVFKDLDSLKKVHDFAFVKNIDGSLPLYPD